MKKRIAILGSTGSIGQSTLDVINRDKFFKEIKKILYQNGGESAKLS